MPKEIKVEQMVFCERDIRWVALEKCRKCKHYGISSDLRMLCFYKKS
jgi:hypothetical protein